MSERTSSRWARSSAKSSRASPRSRGAAAQVYCNAKRADLADAEARLGACDADAELVELAQACLAAAPKHRPRDGGAVVARLSAYLGGVASRLRAAELAQARAEAQVAGSAGVGS